MGLSRRMFTKEFKLAAVQRLERGSSFSEVARALEVNRTCCTAGGVRFVKDPDPGGRSDGADIGERRWLPLDSRGMMIRDDARDSSPERYHPAVRSAEYRRIATARSESLNHAALGLMNKIV